MSDSPGSSSSESCNRNLEQLDMPFFEANGITFHYADDHVDRLPFVFQHGLGADISQPLSFFGGDDCPFRLISMDCRGHGRTVPLGNRRFLRFNSFSDDIIALLDRLNLSKVVIGGISMGAGVALNFAIRYPDRTRALILSRASWLAEPLPANLAVFPKIAELIREHGVHRGKELFAATTEYQTALQCSPANAASWMSQFLRERAGETFEILQCIPNDVPAPDIASWKKMDLPTLVLANRDDPQHPFEYGQVLAREIPGARFAEITVKAISEQKHVEDARREILQFIGETHILACERNVPGSMA
jgi:pimeloyl-ACP methyl ester carboxylesterase